jgi:hypothetical protein
MRRIAQAADSIADGDLISRVVFQYAPCVHVHSTWEARVSMRGGAPPAASHRTQDYSLQPAMGALSTAIPSTLMRGRFEGGIQFAGYAHGSAAPRLGARRV